MFSHNFSVQLFEIPAGLIIILQCLQRNFLQWHIHNIHKAVDHWCVHRDFPGVGNDYRPGVKLHPYRMPETTTITNPAFEFEITCGFPEPVSIVSPLGLEALKAECVEGDLDIALLSGVGFRWFRGGGVCSGGVRDKCF